MSPENQWWAKLIAYISLAFIGGTLGYTMRSLEEGNKVKLGRSILEGLAAGFCGVILLLLCRVGGVGEEMTGVIVGIGGWLGASATIRRIEPLVFRKLGARNEDSSLD